VKAIERVLIAGLLVLHRPDWLFAQPTPTSRPIVTAFQNVNLITMERDGVAQRQTVVVERGRITAIGAAADVTVPADAVIVDGTGRYLLPGLTDAHVHLESWDGGRADFGDAPLYLASGITTVVNLRGTPTFLDWRRRIQSGELTGPTIYTSGEFVIGPWGPELRDASGRLVVGPNVTTPEDAEREVTAQARQRVDLIKF